ncbi:MAG: hypothetical protein LBH08_01505 [Puniceicoccales bacterium]|jgi:hypothetical protein|nr:hypothetical protein [Puniceicoccales bacterium]
MDKNVLGHLFSIFNISTYAKETDVALSIKCDTERLPKKFREKFQLGKYRIDESDGDIRIRSFDIDSENKKKIVDVLRVKRKLLNLSKFNDEILMFLKSFTTHSHHKIVIYLGVGGGIYLYPELFERLIIVKNGVVEWDLKHGYGSLFFDDFRKTRDLIHSVKDDRNIQQFLQKNFDLGEDFCEGKAKIFVYHRPCNSLTSLYFDRHDDDVASIDKKRTIAARAKDVIIWSIAWKITSLLANFLSSVPLVGSTVGLVVTFIGCVAFYKGYQLFCPNNIRLAIDTYIGKNIRSKMPLLSGVLDSCKSIMANLNKLSRSKKNDENKNT